MVSSLTPDDRELIQQLLDDVGTLETQFVAGVPKPQVIRAVFTPILRRLIVENMFNKAQKLIFPEQVKFPIISNHQTTQLCKAGIYKHWMGLVYYGTVGISTGQVMAKYLGKDGKPTIDLGYGEHNRPTLQKAGVFFHQKIFFWKGNFYTREDIIKMHANALGGVHLDFRRKQGETHINEIKNYFGFEVLETNYQMLMGEDIKRGRADPQRREKIFDATELIAMDTVRIFVSGIKASKGTFDTLLA